jgi:uncharacterized membrane protein
VDLPQPIGRCPDVAPAEASHNVRASDERGRESKVVDSENVSDRWEATLANVENVVVIRFPEPSNAYQAISVLKQADADGRIELRAAAVVERTPEGQLRIPEGADNVGLEGTAAGGLIGMLVGILGGPLGMLLGWGTGALVGGVVDLTRAEKGEDALTMLGSAISPGSTAVIADVAEPAIEVVDGEMAKLSGEVTRRPEDDVMAELEAAEEATEAAAKEARRKMREQRKAEVSEKFSERVGKLKDRLHIS